MAMPNPEKMSLEQVLRLVDQLPPEEQEELCRNLHDKIWHMPITIECPENMPRNQQMAELRKDAQEALQEAGVTVEELLAELERVKQEHFAKDYPDLANAS